VNFNRKEEKMYFKACLEIRNKRNKTHEEIMYIQAKNIIHAMEVTKKKRGSRFKYIKPIDYDDYMAGVDLKYKND
jgi:cytidylate kinase